MNSGNFMQRIFVLLFCFIGFSSVAQVMQSVEKDSVRIDSFPEFADPKYREDQFYASIAYSLMHGSPDGYKQYSFSTSLSVGFLRDMPVNKRRNHSVALGLGYSYSNIKHNLVVSQADGKPNYAIGNRDDFSKNKLVMHYIDVPLELRWRNSDSISHKFWRVYLGFKASYLIYNKAENHPNEGSTVKVTNDSNMNKFIYSTYISTGWNTWNFYVSYGLTPIYDTAMIDGKRLKMSPIKLGLIFYIL